MEGDTIAVAADHAGFDLKEILKRDLQDAGYAVLDLGTNSTASVNWPDYGKPMGEAIESGRVRRGVIVCGTGIGISIAANRHRKVRAAPAMTPPRRGSRARKRHASACGVFSPLDSMAVAMPPALPRFL
jgi:RpiB/LacA/LacB family sugar-phosphate isomerase